MKHIQELQKMVTSLQIEAAEATQTERQTEYGTTYDWPKVHQLYAGCRLLVLKLGEFGKVYEESLHAKGQYTSSEISRIIGTLRSIESALKNGQLATIEEMIHAEVLGNLLEHAEVLLEKDYSLAACIVLRAVLEDRLRACLKSHDC